jgi:hypothetical protein
MVLFTEWVECAGLCDHPDFDCQSFYRGEPSKSTKGEGSSILACFTTPATDKPKRESETGYRFNDKKHSTCRQRANRFPLLLGTTWYHLRELP